MKKRTSTSRAFGRRRGEPRAERHGVAGRQHAAARQRGPGVDLLAALRCAPQKRSRGTSTVRDTVLAIVPSTTSTGTPSCVSVSVVMLAEGEAAQIDRQADRRIERRGLRQRPRLRRRARRSETAMIAISARIAVGRPGSGHDGRRLAASRARRAATVSMSSPTVASAQEWCSHRCRVDRARDSDRGIASRHGRLHRLRGGRDGLGRPLAALTLPGRARPRQSPVLSHRSRRGPAPDGGGRRSVGGGLRPVGYWAGCARSGLGAESLGDGRERRPDRARTRPSGSARSAPTARPRPARPARPSRRSRNSDRRSASANRNDGSERRP